MANYSKLPGHQMALHHLKTFGHPETTAYISTAIVKRRRRVALQRTFVRSNTGAAAAAEFGAGIALLGTMLLVFASGLALVYSIVAGYALTQQAVSLAAKAVTFDDALSKASDTVHTLTRQGLPAMMCLQPSGGYQSSGVDLYIVRTDKVLNSSESFGPNLPLKSKPDLARYVYFYNLVTHMRVGPLFGAAPQGFCSIPYVAKSISINFECRKPIEHPESITMPTTDGSATQK